MSNFEMGDGIFKLTYKCMFCFAGKSVKRIVPTTKEMPSY